eukprot:CAMPEP_0201610498 /NCGR_PEP_ID=MMETSP0492-20130828/17041_1 /ASSEMBLY_ACC=CAM_ASM_000837 /TAXON_ID=420259 /ORGANISM="Thalassiosira gravida, Strain GMp14c1" /LENGTH=264 /DNA_ID=CAMNT_0048076345 /DNA_START=280 /DNA_END=1074 /DNA_ORIENTATION=-
MTSMSSNKDPVTEIVGADKEITVGTNSQIDATSSDSASFGESVPYVPLSQRSSQPADNVNSDPEFFVLDNDTIEVDEILKQNRIRNIAVAIASFALAVFNYGYQFAHPITAVEILTSMEKQSAPLTTIGNNGKPTVIDFWAPWCENCKVGAPTLQAVEEEYGDKVNFIMVNADVGRSWPLIQLFGVDAIPHLALLSEEGDVETALIGPMSRNVLRADIDALLNQKEGCQKVEEVAPVCHDDLPYKMYDAFDKKQDGRRINFQER